MSGRALILGARSAIAQALARRLASEGWDLILAARNCAQLQPLASEIELRQERSVSLWEFDAADFESLEGLPAEVRDTCGDFQLVALLFGYMGNQLRVRTDTSELVCACPPGANHVRSRGPHVTPHNSTTADRSHFSSFMAACSPYTSKA